MALKQCSGTAMRSCAATTLQFILLHVFGGEHDLVHRGGNVLKRIAQAGTLQQFHQQQSTGHIADANRLTQAKIHQRPTDMPGFFGRHQQHLKTIHAQTGAGKMFNQHHLRSLGNQLPRSSYRFADAGDRMTATGSPAQPDSAQ